MVFRVSWSNWNSTWLLFILNINMNNEEWEFLEIIAWICQEKHLHKETLTEISGPSWPLLECWSQGEKNSYFERSKVIRHFYHWALLFPSLWFLSLQWILMIQASWNTFWNVDLCFLTESKAINPGMLWWLSRSYEWVERKIHGSSGSF